jgi:hypothetical protein
MPTHAVRILTPCGPAASKRCRLQASRVTLAGTGRCDNSSRDGFTPDIRLASVLKRFADSLEGSADYGNLLRFEEHSSIEGGTDWHGYDLSHSRFPGANTLTGLPPRRALQ